MQSIKSKFTSSLFSISSLFILVLCIALYPSNALAHVFELEDKTQQIKLKCEENEQASEVNQKLKALCLIASQENKLSTDEAALKATWFYGSDVHENLTKKSLELSNVLITKSKKNKKKAIRAYIRGAFWNDDPTVLLWSDKNSKKADTWGIKWYLDFLKAKKQAKNKHFHKNGDNLLARSHFGDLQFIHSMAAKDGEPASATLEKMMLWAEFTYKVGTGRIHRETRLKDVEIEGIRKLFDKDASVYERDIITLFQSERTKATALGSLMHMIQDSYFDGHVEREDKKYWENGVEKFGKGRVIEFHSYTNQNTKLHAKADELPTELIIDEVELNSKSLDPINHGAKILELANEKHENADKVGADWEKVEEYLLKNVFPLVDAQRVAGPGDAFRNKPDEELVSVLSDFQNKPKNSENLSRVLVTFDKGDVSRNIALFYDYLNEISQLKTSSISVDGKSAKRLSTKVIDENIVPKGYPRELDDLICKLNPDKECRNGSVLYSFDESIVVPNMGIKQNEYERRIILRSGLDDVKPSLKKIDEIGRAYFLSSGDIEKYKNAYLLLAEESRKHQKSNVTLKIKLTEYSMEAYVPTSTLYFNSNTPHKINPWEISFTDLDNNAAYKSLSIPAEDSSNSCGSSEDSYKKELKEKVKFSSLMLRALEQDGLAKIAILEASEINANHHDFCNEDLNHNIFSNGSCESVSSAKCKLKTTEKDHGTSIAAIIAAKNNGKGIVGLHPFGDIVGHNILNKNLVSILHDINNESADIVNISWAMDDPKNGQRRPLQPSSWYQRVLRSDSMLFVIAAGDAKNGESQELSESTIYDCNRLAVCAKHIEHAITVTAANNSMNNILSPSFYGKEVIDIAAPGEKVLSATFENGYGEYDGTSQATAFVSGAAALVKSMDPNLFPRQVRFRLMYTADLNSEYINEKVVSGTLNVERAIDNVRRDVIKLRSGAKKTYHGYFSHNRGQSIFLYPPGVDHLDEENRIALKLKDIKRIWYNHDKKNWTVMYVEEKKPTGYELKKLTGVKFQPSDVYDFQKEDDKFRFRTGGKKLKIRLSDIADLYVSAGKNI
ncbi:S8 family serine peptidase [Thalassotalea fusca]